MAKKTKKPKKQPLFKDPNTQLAAAISIFIISAFLASDGKMATWEKEVFIFIYGLPTALTPLFLLVTQLGNITIFFIITALYFLKRHYHVVTRLFLTGLTSYLLVGVAKDLLGRPRPAELLIDVIGRDFYRGPGFPSGHAALATALALTIGYHLPKKYKWLAPLVIVLVMASRIFLGVHAPLDVIAGFGIGWGSYALFRNVRISDIHRNVKTKSINVLKKSPARHILR